MSTWEEIGSTYVESITNALPLHRLIIASSAVLGAIAISHQTHLSIAETIASIEVAQLADIKSTTIHHLKILDISFGILLPVLAWLTSYAATRFMFSLVERGANLKNRATAATEKYSNIKAMNLKDRREEIEILDKSLEKTRVKLKKISSIGEVLCGFGLLFLISSYWGNVLDISLGLLSLFGGFISSGVSLKFFFSDYYGTALFISQLQGKALPIPP